MKRTIILPVILITLFSVQISSGFGELQQTNPKKAPSQSKKQSSQPKVSAAEIAEGKRLLSTSDCMACHKIDVQVVGPSYKDVAKKYAATEANYKELSMKVINGGIGVWGQTPMSPHSSLSEADARKMIKYILSLK